MTTAYVADDRNNVSGGIQKWTSDGAGNWSLAYTLGTGATNIGARGLVVDWSNPNAPIIYGTSAESSANRLFRVVDTGSGSLVSTLATAAPNTVFRGVDMALLPSVWTSSDGGNWSSNTTTTYNSTLGAIATPFNNWSTGLVDGTNLAFQKVNAANLTLNNNSSLTKVASIGFSGQGFGSSDTAYTLTGDALVIDGTDAIGSGVTGSGVTNNSTVTQTVNLGLTLGANQTFAANNGGLIFGGTTLNLGSGSAGYNLTVGGDQNTSISSNIVNGGSAAGSLLKTGAGTLTLSGSNAYTGGTTVSDGTLIGTTSSLQGSITNNGSVRFDQAGTGTFSGNMSGSGSLTKLGSGTVTLSGTNTYSGGTTINAGKLVVASTGSISHSLSNFVLNAGLAEINGSLSAKAIVFNGGTISGSGNIIATDGTTIGAGARIGGTATVTGGLTIAADGTLGPGNSPGTFTSDGNLVINGNYEWEVDTLLTPKADLTIVNGDLDWNGTLQMLVGSGAPAIGEIYSLFAYNGNLLGSPFTNPTGYLISINQTSGGLNASGVPGGYKFVNISAVPEPTSGLLLAAGGIGLVTLRHRRRAA